jgi:AraC-like DNA-binding protein
VKQIAQAAGFDSDKSFIRAFKGWAGLTPDEFRDQCAMK